MDVATLTNTAQAIADMHINSSLTVVMLAIVAVVNAIALFVSMNKPK